MTWTPPAPTCVRSAWLTLGALSVGLEGPGWFCSSLDLGYPDVRDVVSNRPDQDGVDDRTLYMGARTVTANITALAGAGARIDAVASSFAPFMVPSARPVLHYVLDRPGAAERTMTLRAAGYSWPIVGPFERDIQLQWVTSGDPVAYDTTTQTVIAWSGSSTAPGRTYPLVFNRIYPAGGASPTSAILQNAGDVAARPLLRIYGPITAPTATFVYSTGGLWDQIVFGAAFTVNAGHYVEVDTKAKTAYMDGDRTQMVLSSLVWMSTRWPRLPLLPAYTTMSLRGSSTSGITQIQAIWQNGYIT